ncbi:endonuclease domain-containing protein [bacterium]|nr:endonuclease domain-containing protein [bacterium]
MKDLTNLVKTLRKNQTLPEQLIWSVLRNRSFCNCKFRRQVQIGCYIVDFVCYEKMLVIELDGSEHLTDDAIKYDKTRTEELNSRGFNVIRYFNNDVLNKTNLVLEDLYRILNT